MIVSQKREWIVLFIALFFSVGFAWYTYFFQRCASYLIYPILAAHHSLIEPLSHPFSTEKKGALSKKHRILQKKYNKLQARVIELEGTQAYLNGTQELRDFAKRYQQDYRVSRVLSRTLSDQEQSFFIEGGESSGVERDMVVVYCNSVVGKIIEVYPWYSKVCLITDKRCKVGAYCAKTRAQGIHEGSNHSGQTELKYVDHLSSVNEGELVLTSGEGLVFPEGFALGTIASLCPDGLYQKVQVKPIFSIQSIDYCAVLVAN